MINPFLSGRTPDGEAGALFQGGKTALHTDRESACLAIGNIEGIDNVYRVRTFYIYKSTTVVAHLAQDGLFATTASQHDTTGTNAQGFAERESSLT